MAGRNELLALYEREKRRLADAMPQSPEWDAALAAVEELDEVLQPGRDEDLPAGAGRGGRGGEAGDGGR